MRLPKELWSSLFQMFGVAWLMPRRVREFLVSWKGTIGTLYDFGSVEVGSFVFYLVYLDRAIARSFEDRETAMLEWKKMFQFL
jgi:hypothetical protein